MVRFPNRTDICLSQDFQNQRCEGSSEKVYLHQNPLSDNYSTYPSQSETQHYEWLGSVHTPHDSHSAPRTPHERSMNPHGSPSADLHSHRSDSPQASIYTSPCGTSRNTNRRRCPPYRSTRKDSHLMDNSRQVSAAYSPIPMCWLDSHPMCLPKDTREHPCRVCLLYTSPSPRDRTRSRMPSSA